MEPALENALQKRDIADLTKKVEEGFKGVHDRQDLTNGRIAKAEENIFELDKSSIVRQGERKYEKLIWYLFTVSVSTVIALVSFIIFHH